MRNLVTLFFIFISYSLFLLPVNAQWIKSPQNPLIKNSPGTWYSYHAAAPSVISENGLYKMWFQGHDGSTFKIGYGESSDGIAWTIDPNPQIIVSSTGLSNGLEVVEPMVMKNGSLYQMWFKEYIVEENRIRYATSTDGRNWTIYPQPVFTKGNMIWEAFGPTNPSIIFENDEYKMWYVSAGSGIPWQLGYATSPDGINWTRYGNNPLNIPSLGLVGGPSVIKRGNQYHMFYHTGSGGNTNIYHTISNDGINWSCDGSCSILQIEPNAFDSQGITAPSILEHDNTLYLWYGGLSNGHWQIGLTAFTLPVTPTPTLMPTPTPTPTLTPTPYSLHPIILIPGFMASWNKDAILHNKQVFASDWKLAPFIKEYQALINTFKNIGYEEDKNLFIFSYDWRKKIEDSAEDLNEFIKTHMTNRQFSIIGHSLGGLIGRIWLQTHINTDTAKLVSIGTPHKGTAQVYKAVEAGEIDNANSTLWFSEKLLLILNKNGIESDKKTINAIFPVLKDLLPIYPYLSSHETIKPLNRMQIRNEVLPKYEINNSDIYPRLLAISGNKGNTLFGYTVSARTKWDQLLDNYVDGRPMQELKAIGDYVITLQSSGIGNNVKTFQLDHSELIYKKGVIKEILDYLNVNYSDNQIVEGESTIIQPSLIFLLRSPAKMKVAYHNHIYEEWDGAIFIPNAVSGNYEIDIVGNEKGSYTLVSGLIGTKNDEWITTKNATEPNKLDTYSLIFDSKNPKKNIRRNKRNWFWCEITKIKFRNWKIKC
jgi:predicted GH43/DUF377 family glycosyl hydrolase